MMIKILTRRGEFDRNSRGSLARRRARVASSQRESFMVFLLKSAFWLGLVFILMPTDDAARVAGEVSRAATEDQLAQSVSATLNSAASGVTAQARQLCLRQTRECIEAATYLVAGR